ncbi:hypothetical protein SAMN04487970_106524 [Paenibacillus tianmuensis]|uniref:Uncharacterized protein n=1 Tax=Paenibacillus tianmuensis TaxID=624147 RepID=A0A1G4TSI3_9BACL|nr:hypothetical protein [Paenibacillus tianmuensis]SCW84383.1 hypothetical protein SAMN04487970_106524 [Paenibacillus tianmuensis]
MIDNNPFKEHLDAPVLICQHLLDGADLFRVYHLPNEECNWQMICMDNHEKSDMVVTTLAKAYELYPEIGELLDVPDDMTVMFQKGKNSGKWYDFHFDKD